jgi:hypothetical protein
MIIDRIVDRINADNALRAILQTLPGDGRTDVAIDEPLYAGRPGFFIGDTEVPYPTIDVHVGTGPHRHPTRAFRTYTASYPTILVYAPVMAGIDGRGIVAGSLLRIRALLDGWRTSDEGRWLRLSWFDEPTGIIPSVDFKDACQAQAIYQATQPWTLED